MIQEPLGKFSKRLIVAKNLSRILLGIKLMDVWNFPIPRHFISDNSLTWLYNCIHTQGQGSCGGFLVSMVISHLLSVKKINKHMSSYQILRVFLQFLGKESTYSLSLQSKYIHLSILVHDHVRRAKVVTLAYSSFMYYNIFKITLKISLTKIHKLSWKVNCS